MIEVKEKFESRDSLCNRIDTVLVEYFSTLADLYKEQALLEQTMKSGFISMSRARYSMGIKCVGIQQCDENKMNASLKVMVDGNNSFFLENITDIESQMSDLDIQSDNQGSKSNIRRRNIASNAGGDTGVADRDTVEDIGMNELSKDSETMVIKARKIFDPIKWFGLLVPPSLKQSQKDFRSTVDVAVIVANLKTKLTHLQDEYEALLKKKKADFSE